MKESIIRTSLRFLVMGDTTSAVHNFTLIVKRMLKILEELDKEQDSDILIENLRDIIKNYEQLDKYIKIIKDADTEAMKLHNLLYGGSK